MLTSLVEPRRAAIAFAVSAFLVLSPFGSVTNASTTVPTTLQGGAPGLLVANDQYWTPEALEDLLAPVALYPDDFIGYLLVSATNPQEVLDAGDWRPKNGNLDPTTLDAAAKRAGFTPPVRMLIQNPIVLDMMCSE